MSSRLPDLIINLSEIYSKQCREFKETKKIEVFSFIGLKNNSYSINAKTVKQDR